MNEEVLWRTFASRGLGVGAANYNNSDLLPSHFKPIVIYRGQTKLPPLVGTDICGVAPGWVVVVSVNPQTIVTLFGVCPFCYAHSNLVDIVLNLYNIIACNCYMESESQGGVDRFESELKVDRLL
jgi:hypothetical protein